jgi:hypothetical protein
LRPSRALGVVGRAATRTRRWLAGAAASREELAELRARVAEYERGWAPGHFYSPIPSLEEVSRREASIFAEPRRSLPGIDLREPDQLEVLADLTSFYLDHPFRRARPMRFRPDNPNYSLAEAIVLHCMVRRSIPKRIVEIGSGHSSCAILDTNEHLFANAISCTFIDPYADLLRSLLTESDQGGVTIVEAAVQDVDMTVVRKPELRRHPLHRFESRCQGRKRCELDPLRSAATTRHRSDRSLPRYLLSIRVPKGVGVPGQGVERDVPCPCVPRLQRPVPRPVLQLIHRKVPRGCSQAEHAGVCPSRIESVATGRPLVSFWGGAHIRKRRPSWRSDAAGLVSEP